MTPFEDQAPNFTPYIVTLTWTVGDSLYVDCGELEGWEVLALLQQAEEVIREAERTDQDAEGEDADA
jgi:hypothetical protein